MFSDLPSVSCLCSKMVKCLVITILMSICILSQSYGLQNEEDYVDPTDVINFDPVNVRMKTSSKNGNQDTQMEPTVTAVRIPVESDSLQLSAINQNKDASAFQECANIKQSRESFISLFRQYVNRLVHMLEAKVGKEINPVRINLQLQVSYNDISKLRTFGEGGAQDIHEVHEILNNMIQHASDILQPESSIYWFERKMGMSSAFLLQILIFICLIPLLLSLLMRINVSKRILFSAIFLVSVIFTWIDMYQKEVADQEKIMLTHRMRDDCPVIDELAWWQHLTTYASSFFTFQNDKCKDYFRAMLVNPFVKVSPLEAVAVAIVKTVVTPLNIIGCGIKEFFIGLLKDLPIQYQLYMITFVCAAFVLLLFFYCRYNLKILGLISLGPSETHHNFQRTAIAKQQVQEENRVEYLMQGYHFQKQDSDNSKMVTLESPQLTSLAPTVNLNDRCCKSSLHYKPLPEERICHLIKVEQMGRHIQMISNDASQASVQERDPVVLTENINVAIDYRLTEQHLENSRKDECENIETDEDAKLLAKKVKDLNITYTAAQEHESEIDLNTIMMNVNISDELDLKKIQ